MSKFLFCIVFLLFSGAIVLTAQPVKPRYAGHFNIGGLYGSNKTKYQVETIHGVEMNTWFAGIGVGIDDYYQPSIPAFLDVRKQLFRNGNSPFIYLDAGSNIVNKGTELDYMKTEFKSGVFYEAGAGYHVDLGKLGLNIGCGYSYKSHEENLYYHSSIPILPYYSSDWTRTNHNVYSLQRLIIKIGLQF